MMELLPRYPAITDVTPVQASNVVTQPVPPRMAASSRMLLYPYELPIAWLSTPARRAYDIHRVIDAGWAALERSPQLIPRIGRGHSTLRKCTWSGTRVGVSIDPPDLDGLGRWIDDRGDSTVPAYCGVPGELWADIPAHIFVQGTHGELPSDAAVGALLGEANGRPSGESPVRWTVDGNLSARPWSLGVDLESLVVASTPIPVGARIVGPADGISARSCWVVVEQVDSRTTVGEPIRLRLGLNDGGNVFEGVVPGLAPGEYRFSFSLRVADGGTSLRQVSHAEVISHDDLERARPDVD